MRIVVHIHDLPVWSIPVEQVARIAAALPDCEVIDVRDHEASRRVIGDAEVLFATKIRAPTFAAARKLRWMQTSAVGAGGLLIPDVVASDIPVTNARGIHSEAIAEHAIALMLALRRSVPVIVQRQTDRQWAQVELERPVVRSLAGATALVAGLGTIGARIAAMAAGLGMRVTGVRRRTDQPPPTGVSRVWAPGEIRSALTEADVVFIAMPNTDSTEAVIGRAELAVMKPTALLVNIARGEVVDEAALVEALEAGMIAGAGLDAFTEEPLDPSHPFWRLSNVIVSPHVASFSGDYWTPVVDLFLENMRRYRRGEPLLNLVDKSQGY